MPSEPRGLPLLIFDCDGVLVDSEPLANRVLWEMLVALGADLELEESTRSFIGLSLPAVLEAAARRVGQPLPEGFGAELERRTREAFEGALAPVAGIVRVLDALPHPRCVASSGSHPKIRASLELTGLLSRFPEGTLFSAEDVARGKPAPDLFLHAAAVMGHAPADCVVIEDSVPGVRGARAAGMRVLGYVERGPARALAAAGATVFDRMDALPGLLARL